jgi:hypothetical protein
MLVRSVVLTLLLAVVAHGAKFEFTDTHLPALTQIARRHAMYTKADSPSTSFGDGNSEVHINVKFRVSKTGGGTNPVHVIFFHHDELENVKVADRDGKFCCTKKVGDEYLCDGKPTFTPLYMTEQDVPDTGDVAVLKHTVGIQKTGMHYLMYSNCKPASEDVLMTGHNAWLNSYGYLPGELYYNLPFFLVMAVLYTVVVLMWFGLICYYRSDGVLPVQYHIGVVAVLGLMEVVAWYIQYSSYNENGTRNAGLITTAVILSTLKKTTTRILILVVCMGYGIVRPTLGDNATKVMVFGFLYCVFTTCLDVVKALSHEDDISGGFFILVIVPVALLDSVFYYWTFVSLYDVVAALEERKQTIKLNLYRKFLTVVATGLVFSFGWVIFQMWFLYSDAFIMHWQYAWVFDSYWYALMLVLLLTIMYLWKPSSTSMSYAYHEQLSGVEDDLEGIELENSAAFSIGDDEEDEEDIEKQDVDKQDTSFDSLAKLDPELTSSSKDDI